MQSAYVAVWPWSFFSCPFVTLDTQVWKFPNIHDSFTYVSLSI